MTILLVYVFDEIGSLFLNQCRDRAVVPEYSADFSPVYVGHTTHAQGYLIWERGAASLLEHP